MYNNYCPYKYKYELVNWLFNFLKNHPKYADTNINKSAINRKSIKQLRWLYYNLPDLLNKERNLP